MNTPQKQYYGVSIPPDIRTNMEENVEEVYTDLTEVFKLLKKCKEARFKAFRTEVEARHFSANYTENPVTKQVSTPVPNESCAFKSLKSQDTVKFRKAIESENLDYIRACVSENPRYLVSTSDSPTILQEGSRHNGLHVAAKLGRAESALLILSFVKGDIMRLMYPEEDTEQNLKRSDHLLDLYLNMPDKGAGDTPLHLAAKFGHTAIVEILASQAHIKTGMMNKFNETPLDVVCTRTREAPGPGVEAKIREIISGQLYIPVYKHFDLVGGPSTLGKPSTLQDVSLSADNFSESTDFVDSPHHKPARTRCFSNSPVSFLSPCSPVTPQSPLLCSSPGTPFSVNSPPVFLSAVLGPLSQENAALVYKQLRQSPARDRLNDPSRGLEKQGREIAKRSGSGWREYWHFLETYADLTSEQGLNLLETYLANKQLVLARKEEAERCREVEEEEEEGGEGACDYPDVFMESGELEIFSRNVDVSEPVSPLSALASNLGTLTLEQKRSTSPELAQTGGRRESEEKTGSPVEETISLVRQFSFLFAQCVMDNIPNSHSDCDLLDWGSGLLPHWDSLRRHVNNMRSDPVGRWSGLDYHSFLVKIITETCSELEMGLSNLELSRLMNLFDRLAGLDLKDKEDSTQLDNFSSIRQNRVEPREWSRISGIQPLARYLAAYLDNRRLPSGSEVGNIWDFPLDNQLLASNRVNKARKFLHSKVLSSDDDSSGNSRGSTSGEFTQFNLQATSEQPRARRDSGSSQCSTEYGTPPTSPVASSLFTADEGASLWIDGDGPTQTDRQVCDVLQNVSLCDLSRYPQLSLYLSQVLNFSAEERKHWPQRLVTRPSPGSRGRRAGQNKKRLEWDDTE